VKQNPFVPKAEHMPSNMLQFGNISNFAESENDSDDGWNEISPTEKEEQCTTVNDHDCRHIGSAPSNASSISRSHSGYKSNRDSWGDVWEDVSTLSVNTAAEPLQAHQPKQSSLSSHAQGVHSRRANITSSTVVGQTQTATKLTTFVPPNFTTINTVNCTQEAKGATHHEREFNHWESVQSESIWSDVDNEKNGVMGGYCNWKNDDIEDWKPSTHEDKKEKLRAETRGEISYAQAAGAIKQEKPQSQTQPASNLSKNISSSDWVQQMIQNKNYQEFVPSSRPISRTPSESAQSEIDDGQQYRPQSMYRHPNRLRAMPIAYNPMTIPYATRYTKRGSENVDASGNKEYIDIGELNLQQSYHQAIPMVMIPAMIPAPLYSPHMNQNI